MFTIPQTVNKEWAYHFVGYGDAPSTIPEFTVYIEVQSTDEETAYWGGTDGNKAIFVGPVPRPH